MFRQNILAWFNWEFYQANQSSRLWHIYRIYKRVSL